MKLLYELCYDRQGFYILTVDYYNGIGINKVGEIFRIDTAMSMYEKNIHSKTKVFTDGRVVKS